MLIKRGSKGSIVRKIQAKLQIGIDGDFGEITESAVDAFQQHHNLIPTGMVDDATWIALFGSLPNGSTKLPTTKTGAGNSTNYSTPPIDPNRCSCEIGLTNDMFIKSFFPQRVGKKDTNGNPLPPPVLFTHSNMNSFLEARNTSLERFIQELTSCFDKYEINSCTRKAHFLAQIWWESDRFNTLQEYASGNAYDPGKRPDAKLNGNTTVGDGPRFKGRGCMQLTWKNNYKKYQQYLDQSQLGHSYNVVDDPYSVSGNIFLALDSAGWFWTRGKIRNDGSAINLNSLADESNTDRISVLVNGGGNGKSERRMMTQKLLGLFNANRCIHG